MNKSHGRLIQLGRLIAGTSIHRHRAMAFCRPYFRLSFDKNASCGHQYQLLSVYLCINEV
ncbi:hypothetical protein JHU04_004062 [Brenneria sp. 4F2]|nr:hypothetical protein [Brenneria bubanii]